MPGLSERSGPSVHRGRSARPHSRRRPVYYAAAILGIVLAASAVYGFVSSRAATKEVKVGATAPDMTFTTIDGKVHRLAEFRGRPVMLWLFATWCPSCQAGTAAVAEHLTEMEQAGLQIIQLKLYNNLGYSGPSVRDFARAYARPGRSSPNWLWGDASGALSYIYDPRVLTSTSSSAARGSSARSASDRTPRSRRSCPLRETVDNQSDYFADMAWPCRLCLDAAVPNEVCEGGTGGKLFWRTRIL
jgi:thiol-disulfide isomerase/thioredoxin